MQVKVSGSGVTCFGVYGFGSELFRPAVIDLRVKIEGVGDV